MSDSHDGGGLSLPVLLGALICAGVTAILADLMTPYGPVLLTMAMAFAALTLAAGILSLLPPLTGILRPVAAFALLNAIACGALVGLSTIAPKPAANERGVVAALLPYGQTLQSIVVTDQPHGPPVSTPAAAPAAATPAPPPAPLTPADQKQQTLLTALASADPAARLRGGMSALGERDPAVLAGVIDTLYRSPDPAVRQLAVKRLLSQRRGTRMPLLAVPGNAQAQAFANALQGAGLTVRAINETSGAFDGGLCGPTGMTGAVNRGGVTISAKCKTGATDGNTVLVLQPTDAYTLTGEARNDQGQTAKVEVPLM